MNTKKLMAGIGIATLLSLLTGCASTHPGNMGHEVGGNTDATMKVSAQKQKDYSDENYTFVTFTIENTSEQFLRIKSAEISFDPTIEKSASVLVGEDLVSWATSEEEQLEKTKQNKRIAKLILLAGGALVGGIGNAVHSDAARIIGGTALVGGAAWTVSDAIHAGTLKSENPARVPNEHIYAPFAVPIGKFMRKWAVIQHPKDMTVDTVFLKLITVDGQEGTYAIRI